MTWLYLSQEVRALFAPLVVVNTDLESPDVFFQRFKGFAPDLHPAADHFVSAPAREQERIRRDASEARAQARARALAAPRWQRARRAPQREVTSGRRLVARSGKVTESVHRQILDLSNYLSERRVALRLHLSRATIARALGKGWAFDPRKNRSR